MPVPTVDLSGNSFSLELSRAQLGEVWGAESDAEGAALLARIAQVEDIDEEPRKAIWVDFMYQQLAFAKEQRLIASKALAFFDVMLKTHAHAVGASRPPPPPEAARRHRRSAPPPRHSAQLCVSRRRDHGREGRRCGGDGERRYRPGRRLPLLRRPTARCNQGSAPGGALLATRGAGAAAAKEHGGVVGGGGGKDTWGTKGGF